MATPDLQFRSRLGARFQRLAGLERGSTRLVTAVAAELISPTDQVRAHPVNAVLHCASTRRSIRTPASAR
jgi:hypothetical protein